MKYIVFQDGSAITFSDTLSHKEVAGNKRVQSAGFCVVETYRDNFDNIKAKVSCYGESTSLGVGSLSSDNEDVARIFRFGL